MISNVEEQLRQRAEVAEAGYKKIEAEAAVLREALRAAPCWCKRPKLVDSDTCDRCYAVDNAPLATAARSVIAAAEAYQDSRWHPNDERASEVIIREQRDAEQALSDAVDALRRS